MGQKVKEEPKESAGSFFGRFMSSGTKEQTKETVKTEVKKEIPEKKSIFGFFGRSSSKKEIVIEKKPEASKVQEKSLSGVSIVSMTKDEQMQRRLSKSNDEPDNRKKISGD